MPNQKISQLSDGSPAQDSDIFPIARSGANFSLSVEDVLALATLPSLSGNITNAQMPVAGAYQWIILTADGTTDNHAVLAAALAAVPANGGTIYLVPNGSGLCYISQSISVTTNNTVIIGSGWGTTNLLSDQGACTLQFAAGQPGIVVNGAKCVVIENLCVLSKDTGATAGDNGIWFKGQSGLFVLRNVSVQKFGNIGILIDSTSGGNIDQWRIDQCFVYENFSDGFQILGGTDGNVGIATGLNCTANGGWGMNIDSGAGANVFIIPQITGNAGGGIRVNQSNNSFYDVYMESTAVSSFVITALGNNNYVKFHNFGQPTTITNSGGGSNVFVYHDANGFVGYANLTVCKQNFTAGRTYQLQNGSFNGNDFSITDDLGVTWLDINQSLGAVLALKTLAAANIAAATLSGSTNSGILQLLSNYWNPSFATGVVNTSSTGNTVAWVSGDVFFVGMVGHIIVINGVSYTVATFVSSTSITLSTSPGSQSGVSYAFGQSVNELWNLQTVGGSGANGSSTLTLSHSGTTGALAFEVTTPLKVDSTLTQGASGQNVFSSNGHIKTGTDTAGQATVTAGNTTQAVSFTANYTGTAQPCIVLTPTSAPGTSYWVTYSGSTGAWTGFTVNIAASQAGNVTFNYLILAQA